MTEAYISSSILTFPTTSVTVTPISPTGDVLVPPERAVLQVLLVADARSSENVDLGRLTAIFFPVPAQVVRAKARVTLVDVRGKRWLLMFGTLVGGKLERAVR